MADIIERVGYSVVHRAELCSRLTLLRLAKPDFPGIIPELKKIAEANQYGKILCKIPDWAKQPFLDEGFRIEATIYGCLSGTEDMHFVAFFTDAERGNTTPELQQMVDGTIHLSRASSTAGTGQKEMKHKARGLTLDEMDDLAKFNAEVFGDQPSLSTSVEYLKETHQKQFDYYGVFDGLRLIAAASVEIDELGANAELKDMGVRESYRGEGLSMQLLNYIESHLRKNGIKVIYSLARSLSANHNSLFVDSNYKMAGTLLNDSYYQGANEPMNVWYKHIEADESFGDTFGAMFRLEEREETENNEDDSGQDRSGDTDSSGNFTL